jgi:hypothetical protein
VVPNHALYQAKLRPESREIITTIPRVVHPPLWLDSFPRYAGSVAVSIPRDALFRYRFATPRRVIDRWVTPDLSDCKIFGLRITERFREE